MSRELPASPTDDDPLGRIVGRDAELARIDAAARELRRPWGVLVEGAPGMGKTTLWRAATERLGQRAPRVLVCRPVEAEASLAFGGLIDLFEPVGSEVLARLPEPQRDALAIALRRSSAGPGTLDPLAVSAGARAVVRALGLDGPLVLAIDDVQWLDASTASILAYVARRSVDEPIGWLLAARAGTAVELIDVLRPLVDAISLQPLSLSSLHHIIRSRTGRVFPRPTLHRIAEASGGNALFALELAASLDADAPQSPADPLPIPPTLHELVARRVRRVPRAARRALLVAASVATPTADLVERATGRDEQEAIDASRSAGILAEGDEILRFAHPLFARSVVRLANASERREVHRRLAELIDEPEERARHLALATTGVDDAVADALDAGAQAARARGALHAAAELIEQARALMSDPSSSRGQARALAAAELHVLAGDRPRARRVLDELPADTHPDLRARALGLRAEILVNAGDIAEGEALIVEALERIDEPLIRARLELDLSYIGLLDLDTERATLRASEAATHADAAGDSGLLAEAVAYRGLARTLHGEPVGEGELELALRLEERSRAPYMGMPPSAVVALAEAFAGQHGAARRHFARAAHDLEALGDECDLAHVRLWSSWLEMRAGDLRTAAEAAASAATVAEMTGSPLLHAWSLAQGGLVAATRGDAPGAALLLRETRAHDPGSTFLIRLWVAAASGTAALVSGDFGRAWASLDAATELLELTELRDPALAFFAPEAIEALVGLGHVARADSLGRRIDDVARRLDRRWAIAVTARCRAIVHAARGDVAAGLAATAAALDGHADLEMPWERARLLTLHGRLLRRGGERRGARAAFEEAIEGFRAIGADGWAAAADEELRRVPVGRRSTELLTPGELQVATLSGSGRTNRDVAALLFVSPKTVEANLTRIYRKLGIATRAELGAWVARANEDRVEAEA